MASSILQLRCSYSSPRASLPQPLSRFSSPSLQPLHHHHDGPYRHCRVLVVKNVAAQPHPHSVWLSNEGDAKKNLANGKSSEIFDAAVRPPFTLADIRAAIPKHCWVKDPWRSMSYVARDVAVVLGLAAGAAYLNSWLVWPLYWFAQGTMFWALFVLGHDCGHGSFSHNKMLNDLVGHLTHSSILVPYHGWRISHRTHHQNHGHVEKDESWHPLSEKLYRSLDSLTHMARFSPLSMLAYPLYLWARSPGKHGSHFHPSSPLFVTSERNEVLMSTACWSAMVTLLIGLTFVMGPMWMLKLYAVPYLVFVLWLDVVTYLHHHGHDEKIPWYRGQEWNYMRGGLSTIDRDYGWFNNMHHDIGTHVVHHLFPQIPHYHLVEAVSVMVAMFHYFYSSNITEGVHDAGVNLLQQHLSLYIESLLPYQLRQVWSQYMLRLFETAAVKPVLGKYYREPAKSHPFPTHLWHVLMKSFLQDHFVDDEGDIVFYQADSQREAS